VTKGLSIAPESNQSAIGITHSDANEKTYEEVASDGFKFDKAHEPNKSSL